MPERNRRFALMASATALGNRRGEVMIYSAITDWTWGDSDPAVTSNRFDKALKELGDVDEITVRINSPGGAVSEAIAIRTMLMKHPATKIVDIEGACDSAATLIACLPGAKVRMAKGGEYMIHRCTWGARGHADTMLAAYNSMMNTDRDMADIYAERTGKTQEECLELMTAETWFTADTAMEAGFVDEIIASTDGEEPIAACSVDAETADLMRACYAHAPEHAIKAAQPPANETPGTSSVSRDAAATFPREEGNNVSNGNTAVATGRLESRRDFDFSAEPKNANGQIGDLSAAPYPSENNQEGVNTMDELRNATAEQLEQENPELAASIGRAAVEAERERLRHIDDVTPEREEYAQMRADAKANGTSFADYLKLIAAKSRELKEAENKKRADYLANREKETANASNVGGGDAGDHDGDDSQAKQDRVAKELATLADSMDVTATEM